MVIKVGINGFGRVGRIIFRTCFLHEELEITAINDPAVDIEYICYLIKFDSTHGKLTFDVSYKGNEIRIDGRAIKVFHLQQPGDIPWSAAGVEYVVEASGMFATLEKASGHLRVGGVKRVLLTAPSLDIPMLVLGVNNESITKEMKVLSCGSSTLYCLATLVKVLVDNFGVEDGFITTIHAMTPSLKPLDGLCLKGKQWREHRGITQNIIPAVTGACRALGRVVPAARDRIAGVAFRVPIANVSVLDTSIRLTKHTTLEAIVQSFEEASKTTYRNIITTSHEQNVSSDFIGDIHSCILDVTSSLQLRPNFFKLVCWYENEYSYACRVVDTILFSEKQFHKSESSCTNMPLETREGYDVQQTVGPKTIECESIEDHTNIKKRIEHIRYGKSVKAASNILLNAQKMIVSNECHATVSRVNSDQGKSDNSRNLNSNQFSTHSNKLQYLTAVDRIKTQEKLDRLKGEFHNFIDMTEGLLKVSHDSNNKLGGVGRHCSKEEFRYYISKSNTETTNDIETSYRGTSNKTLPKSQSKQIGVLNKSGDYNIIQADIASLKSCEINFMRRINEAKKFFEVAHCSKPLNLRQERRPMPANPLSADIKVTKTAADTNTEDSSFTLPVDNTKVDDVNIILDSTEGRTEKQMEHVNLKKFSLDTIEYELKESNVEGLKQQNIQIMQKKYEQTANKANTKSRFTEDDNLTYEKQPAMPVTAGNRDTNSLNTEYTKHTNELLSIKSKKSQKTTRYIEPTKHLKRTDATAAFISTPLCAVTDTIRDSQIKRVKLNLSQPQGQTSSQILKNEVSRSINRFIHNRLPNNICSGRNSLLQSTPATQNLDRMTQKAGACEENIQNTCTPNLDTRNMDTSVDKVNNMTCFEKPSKDNDSITIKNKNHNKEQNEIFHNNFNNDGSSSNIIVQKSRSTDISENTTRLVDLKDEKVKCNAGNVPEYVTQTSDSLLSNRSVGSLYSSCTENASQAKGEDGINFSSNGTFEIEPKSYEVKSPKPSEQIKAPSASKSESLSEFIVHSNVGAICEDEDISHVEVASKNHAFPSEDGYKQMETNTKLSNSQLSKLGYEIEKLLVVSSVGKEKTLRISTSIYALSLIDEKLKNRNIELIPDTDINETNDEIPELRADKFLDRYSCEDINTSFCDSIETGTTVRPATSNDFSSHTYLSRQDIYDKLDTPQASDSEKSFAMDGKKSQVISIKELTTSWDNLERLDKICRIMEISDDLSDKLFSTLDEDAKANTSKIVSKWSLKELCEKIKLDEFCSHVFGK